MRSNTRLVALAALLLSACGSTTPTPASTSSTPGIDPAVAASVDKMFGRDSTRPPSPSDFALKLTITSKKCFGSAGCNVEFKITPSYAGTQTKLNGSYQVIYVVKGLEDEYTNSFTVDEDFNAQLNSGESGSTKTTKVKLTAAVTEIIPA